MPDTQKRTPRTDLVHPSLLVVLKSNEERGLTTILFFLKVDTLVA